MATNNLTDAALRALKPQAAPYKVSDGEGLHILVQPNGAKLWRVAYRFVGKQKTLALGAYPLVGLADARAGRSAAKALLQRGKDPTAERRVERQKVVAQAMTVESRTFAAVAGRWFAARKASWVTGYADRVWSRVEHDLNAHFGHVDIAEIDSSTVLTTLRKIQARDALEMAHRVKNYAREIFRFARSERLITVDPTDELERALARPAPKKRRAALKARDLPAFLRHLDVYDGEKRTKLALTLTMLTFVRTSEIRFARWQEFEQLDGLEPLWRIPAERMKMRNEHLVPLSAQAVAVVKALKALEGASPLLFPAATKSEVMSENTMIFALYRMGYHTKATVHGFRGTASTILNENGFNRDWIERQLAHVEQDEVRAAYNTAQWLPQRRDMMTWWANYLDMQRHSPITTADGLPIHQGGGGG
jgi:integrase